MAEQTPPEEGKKPKSKFKLIVLPLALVALVGGGFVGFTQYGMVTRALAMTHGSGGGVDAENAPEGDAPEGGSATPVEYGVFYQFDGITANTIGQDGSHFLMMNLGVEAPEETIIEELKSREIVARDTVLKLLSVRSAEELILLETRNELKEEVRNAFNGILSEGQITRVYFTQYVLQ